MTGLIGVIGWAEVAGQTFFNLGKPPIGDGVYEGSELLMELAMAIRHGILVKSLTSEFHHYLTLSEGLKLAALTFDKDVKKLSCCAV